LVTLCLGDCKADTEKNKKKCEGDICKACKDGECIERGPKSLPDSPYWAEVKPQAPRLNASMDDRGRLTFFKRDGTGANWTAEAKAYCDGSGNWKFKVSKILIQPVIQYNHAGTTEATDSAIDALVSQSQSETCARLEDAEFTLRNAAAFRNFPKDVLAGLLAGNVKPGAKALPGGLDMVKATLAHEAVHVGRLAGIVNEEYREFMDQVERITKPIKEEEDLEMVEASIKTKVEEYFSNMEQRVYEAYIQSREYMHPNPTEYYVAALGVFQAGPLRKISDLRLVHCVGK